MAENQHNDNLEQFFKANLEGYSPKPSDDFWSRMEPVIPVKPPFWSGWGTNTGKWIWLALLAVVTILVLWFWQRDRSQIVHLKQTVAQQEQRIQQMDAASQVNESEQAANEIPALEATVSASQQAVASPSSTVNGAIVSSSEKQSKSSNFSENAPVAKQKKTQKIKKEQLDLKELQLVQSVENQVIEKSEESLDEQLVISNPSQKLENALIAEASSNTEANLEIPSSLASRNTLLSPARFARPLIVKAFIIRPKIDYPRFSAEVDATAFRLPLGRLFEQDTFLTGSTGLSYGAGFKVNYELNSSTALQAGYQFTNLRASRLALRYNSFPVAVLKRWAWGRRSHLEGKLGASVNSLVSARTDSDGQSVKGLKPTWFGIHAGVAASWRMSENLSIVAGPNAGFSLTPMTAGRRSWEIGVGAGLRYQL